MPLYEYQCDACGHRFEVIRKFSDEPLETCPKCGGHVQKLIAAPAFQFKGSGWYITDYAKKDSSPGSKTESKRDESKEGSTGKSDSSAKTESSTKSESSAKSESDAKSSAKTDAPGTTKAE
jgi:putative FmdB family regulatory protein